MDSTCYNAPSMYMQVWEYQVLQLKSKVTLESFAETIVANCGIFAVFRTFFSDGKVFLCSEDFTMKPTEMFLEKNHA